MHALAVGPWQEERSRPRATVECRVAGGNMDWVEFLPFLAVLGLLLAMWWRLDSKIETRIGRLEKLLTDNLIALNRDIGELKGQAHTPN